MEKNDLKCDVCDKPTSSLERLTCQHQACTSCVDKARALACNHRRCSPCWAQHLRTQFEEKRLSFLLIKCPGPVCEEKLPEAFFRDIASAETLKRLDAVFRTIPNDGWSSIDDFCYEFRDEALRHKETGDKFHFVSQAHYDALGDIIVRHVQERMMRELGMKEVLLPVDPCPAGTPRSNIFLTPDALTNPTKLMLLIQGSGAVRAGQWARALCINENLNFGTILPYLRRAIKEGYGVIVFNPNLNRVNINEPKRTRKDLLSTAKPAPSTSKSDFVDIPGSEDPAKHTIYVWDHFASRAKAKELCIVAHSAGGWCTMSLLREREAQVLPKLRVIAFTDSVSSVSPKDPPAVQKFLRKHAVNFVASDKPLDTPIPMMGDGCKCVSSGHTKHEYTSHSAIESVFKLLSSRMHK